MTSKFNFSYEGISHYGIDGELKKITHRYVAYFNDQVDMPIGILLNIHYFSKHGDKTKKMIENNILWAFESCCRKVQSITFDDVYNGSDYNTKIKSDFSCAIEYSISE